MIDRKDDNEADTRSDPGVYFEWFRNSPEYSKCFISFKSDKKIVDEGHNEMRDLFEEMEIARQALLEFSKKNYILKYNPSNYGAENPIREYLELLEEHKSHPDRFNDVIAYDLTRYSYHQKAAKFLTNKYNIPENITEGMVQLMAIEKGLEDFDEAQVNRVEKLRNTLV